MNSAEILEEGLIQLGLGLNASQQSALLAYLALMLKWNRVYNLTAVRDEQAMIRLHLLDSLSIVPHLQGKTLADIGSGGGLPGIPVAIVRPDMRVTLIESNQKKSAFQKQVAIELALSNVQIECARVEHCHGAYDIVSSRAFADMADFVKWTAHLLAEGGVMAAMKGQYPADEIARLPDLFHVEQSIKLTVPGLDSERHLVIIRKH